MKNETTKLSLLAITLLSLGSIGCASRGGILGVDCCADVPAGAIPEPAGTKLCQWQSDQINAAAVDRNVLYQADFVGRTIELSPGANDRLSRSLLSGTLDVNHITIEPSGDDSLDHARVAAVIDTLTSAGVSAPDVRIAVPAALGLTGPQAERVAGNALNSRNGSISTGVRGGIGSVLSGGVFP